jgi:hypothetical protein
MTGRHRQQPEPFSSNAVRLSIREWVVLLAALVLLVTVSGPAWTRVEEFHPSSDYRIPYASSEDYWLFDRLCREAGASAKTFIIGDSFVWGQYVGKNETLSHFLNRRAGTERFVNAGLDGAHPMALEGLIKNHCGGLQGRDVILHLNLLWVSSPQADLQTGGAVRLNHPRLVPQFLREIPAHDRSVSEKLSVVVARHVPFLAWARHVRITYYSSADLPHWILENPYRSPLAPLDFSWRESNDLLHATAQPWFVDGRAEQELPWVELEASLQWRAFQRSLEMLRSWGSTVFVLVGPLNEHMLEPLTLAAYRGILSEVEDWMRDEDLAYYIPPTLPSELYGDMSHPLGEGYELLAEDLWARLTQE